MGCRGARAVHGPRSEPASTRPMPELAVGDPRRCMHRTFMEGTVPPVTGWVGSALAAPLPGRACLPHRLAAPTTLARRSGRSVADLHGKRTTSHRARARPCVVSLSLIPPQSPPVQRQRAAAERACARHLFFFCADAAPGRAVEDVCRIGRALAAGDMQGGQRSSGSNCAAGAAAAGAAAAGAIPR